MEVSKAKSWSSNSNFEDPSSKIFNQLHPINRLQRGWKGAEDVVTVEEEGVEGSGVEEVDENEVVEGVVVEVDATEVAKGP